MILGCISWQIPSLATFKPERANVTILFDLLCSRQDILEAIPNWITFPSCPLHMAAPLVFR